MRTYTTPSEDAILDACELFGGLAEECAAIVTRLDDKLDDTCQQIGKLEAEIEALEQELEEMRNR